MKAFFPFFKSLALWIISSSSGFGASTSLDFVLGADKHWAFPGLYINKGTQIEIHSSGSWSHESQPNGTHYGPSGLEPIYSLDSCPFGSLVGKIGLDARSPSICLGTEKHWVSERDGFLFLQMNDGYLEDNQGNIIVQIKINNDVPVSTPVDTTQFGWEAILSGLRSEEVAISTEHFELVISKTYAEERLKSAEKSLAVLDDIYNYSRKLLGGNFPYKGQKIRIVFDPFIEDSLENVFMIAGNPIRVDQKALHYNWNDDWGMDFLKLNSPQ